MVDKTDDIYIRKAGRAGRITLQRPDALNALTYDMCLAVDAALVAWARDDAVDLVIIDALGDRAFCAGGDIADLYARGRAGDFAYGRQFWRDEYRMNARIADYPKPVVSFLQGFTMGGGVGLGCHGSHRIVCDSSRIAMPECGIGLVPDVGGTFLLARAPVPMGAYLALTAARMGPGDAIHAGFADAFVPQDDWPAVIDALTDSGSVDVIPLADAPTAPLPAIVTTLGPAFQADTVAAILDALTAMSGDPATKAAQAISRNSPLAMAATLEILERLQSLDQPTIQDALTLEYRFTWRAMDGGDFLEGIRAQIIDKDRTPHWQIALPDITADQVAARLAPLGDHALTFDQGQTP